ncbi:hypothetical protein ABTU21_003836 [Escherichia coli]|nr:hypothetical protein [Escherichia coli]MCC5019193.1 hypothetical protein [Escherichia coli]
MKQMSLIEMDGFLKGKCIPRDLKVNETNAEYLVRKFAELESKLGTALRECRSAGITIDNLEAKCAELAAENAAFKDINAWCKTDAFSNMYREFKTAEAVGCCNIDCMHDAMVVAIMHAPEAPATDAFLAEIERKAIRKFINSIQHILRDKLSPYDTEEMLEAMRIFLEEQSGEQK